jgi:SAM-dependent methyltransferase
MDLKDESFDYAIGSFVFSYIFLSKGKFCEILRVLKKGGKAGFSVWGVQDDQKWLNSLFTRYLSNKESNKSTDNKSSTSRPERFDTVQDIKRILIESGFANVRVYQENNDVVYKNKEEWWQEMRSNAALRMFEQIEKLGMDKLENFKMDVYEQLANFEKEDGYHFNMPVIYAFGEK